VPLSWASLELGLDIEKEDAQLYESRDLQTSGGVAVFGTGAGDNNAIYITNPGIYTLKVKNNGLEVVQPAQKTILVLQDKTKAGTIPDVKTGYNSVLLKVRENTFPKDAIVKYETIDEISADLNEIIGIANDKAANNRDIYYNEALVRKTLRKIDAYDSENRLINNFMLTVAPEECQDYYAFPLEWLGKCQTWKPTHTQLAFYFDRNQDNDYIKDTNIEAKQLRVFRLNEEKQKWELPSEDVTIDTDYNYIELNLLHFSIYCVMGGVGAAEEGKGSIDNIMNYPNPFASGAGGTEFMFNYHAPSYDTSASKVTVNVYTVSGRMVKVINSDGESNDIKAEYGQNQIFWNGLDEEGNKLVSGVYYYVIKVEDAGMSFKKLAKLVIIK